MTNSISNGRFGNLRTWDPTRLFDDLMSWNPAGSQVVWQPASPVHVESTDDGAIISVDMPGVDPQDVDLTFEAGELSITGKRGARTYRYTVTLADSIDPNTIEAELDKGVLTVRAHVKPEAKPRKITLKGFDQKQLNKGE